MTNSQLLNNEKLLEKPIPPEPHECCESGCGEYCVFELYLDEKRKYDEQQAQLTITQNAKPT